MSNHYRNRDRKADIIKRSLAAMTLVALALIGTAPPAVTRSLPEPIQLGAVNTIVASETAYTEVRIPEPATLPFKFFRNPDLQIEGRGRLTGLFLVQQDVAKPAAIYSMNLNNCYEAACKPRDGWFMMFPTGIKWKNKLDIPAGDYRLYVVTDGDEVSATLKLGGLTGTTEIHPTNRVHSEVGTAAASPPVNNVYSGGSTYELPNKGLAILAFSNETSASAADVNNDCLYKGRPPIDDAIAYAPGCTAHGASEGEGLGFSTPPFLGGGGGASLSMRTKMAAGKWSFGGSWVAAERVDFAAFTSLWMSYD